MSEIESCLERGLAAKGIGPKGLKPLAEQDLAGAIVEIAQGRHSDALAATFLMGFQVLERDESERAVFSKTYLENKAQIGPELQDVFELLELKGDSQIQKILIKLAHREDLDDGECQFGVDMLLDPQISEVYKAAFLQGLRVKRETDEENLSLYKSLFSKAPRRELDGMPDVIVDWSDPYDGMNRHANLSFLGGVVLSAMGVPVVMHSTSGLGPKYGLTVLDSLGSDGELNLSLGEQALNEHGLAVLDQAKVFPEMKKLQDMRNSMKKRPFLATIEKMMMPFKAKKRTVLVTGYVHKAYKSAIPEMVMSHKAYDEILLVKGIEGSVLLDPSKKISAIFAEGETSCELEFKLNEKGASPKEELKPSDIENILTGKDVRWDTLSFTVSKILEIVFGRSAENDIILEMTRLKNEGLLLNHYQKVRSFYSCSGEYV